MRRLELGCATGGRDFEKAEHDAEEREREARRCRDSEKVAVNEAEELRREVADLTERNQRSEEVIEQLRVAENNARIQAKNENKRADHAERLARRDPRGLRGRVVADSGTQNNRWPRTWLPKRMARGGSS